MRIPKPLSPKKIYAYVLVILVYSLSSISTQYVYAQQKAFPTAYGGGANATGGRGGNVYHVTNLLDDGSVGSFRWALAQPRPATIVFDVSGTINMPTPLRITGKDLTIAGQTAPEGGITLTYPGTGKLSFGDSENIIMRYVRVRPEFQGDVALQIFPGYDSGSYARNLIFDHISISYAGLQGFTVRGYATHNITFQNGIIAECGRGSLFGDTDNVDYSYNNTFRTSLFYNISHRLPNSSSGRADIYNNVIYDWTSRLTTIKQNALVNHFNNYYYLGNKTDIYYQFQNEPPRWHVNAANNTQPDFPFEIYTAGNIVQDVFTDPTADNQYLWIQHEPGAQTIRLDPSFFRSTPFEMIGEVPTIMPAVEASTVVPNEAGANKYLNSDGTYGIYRDEQDTRYTSNTLNDIPTPWDGNDGTDGRHTAIDEQPYADFLASISTTPINTRPENFYASNPHIPEAWFLANVPPGQDHNDIAPSGYTWLEEYMNRVDGPIEVVSVTGVAISPNTATVNLSVPETITLEATIIPDNATNQNGVWSSSDESIATVDSNGLVTPVAEGSVDITYTTNDGGFTDTATITVTNIVISAESVTLNPESLTLELEDTYTFVPEILPSDTTFLDGTWETSDASVLTVDDNGLITPLTTGEATVTFTHDESGISDTSIVTVIDTFYGTYEFYNAQTDEIIQNIEGNASFNIFEIGDQVNMRGIPQGGDTNADVGSVVMEWTGVVNGSFLNNEPIYSLMEDHVDFDFEAYTIVEGTYNFRVTYYSENSANGEIIAIDTFSLEFFFDEGLIADAGDDQSICEGDTVTLTASSNRGTDYLWSTGETTESIEVTPNVTTTFTVTVSNDDGEEAEDSVVVTVNEIPLTDAGEDQSICVGETITLTASGGDNYLWNTGETTQSIIVSPTATTSYAVEVSNGGCSVSDSVEVIVNEIPNLSVTNDVTILVGDSVTLTANGATDYLWSTGDTSGSIEVSPTTTTTYSVTGTSNACSSSSEITVTVLDAIAASAGNDQTICEGETTTLTASGGINYLWSTGETTASINVSPSSTTTYTVTASDNSGINTDSDSVTVNVNALPTANAGNDQNICLGETVTLTASGGSDYLWSTGETTQSISVSPSATATYSVEVTLNGCSSSDSVTVSVDEGPDVNAGNNITIVIGESATLNATGASSYQWNIGDTTASIVVSPTETTTYTVTGTTNNCSNTDSVTVTVVDSFEASAGDDQRVCMNSNDQVVLTANEGDSYLWSTGETTRSITVSPTSTTTYTVEVTSGIQTDTDDVTVYVDPNPNVTIVNGNNVDVLEGEFITLSASGANTYQWSNGATQPNIAVSPSTTTTYEVRGYINDCYDDKQVVVNVVERVIASAGEDVSICLEERATLTATGGDEYLWSTGEVTQSIEVSPETTTTYTVTVFNALDYDEASVTVNVDTNCDNAVINPPLNENLADFDLLAYPNPVDYVLKVKISGLYNVSNMYIYDITGKIVFQQEISNEEALPSFTEEIDVSGYQNGIYLLKLLVENGNEVTRKIIVN